MDPDQLPMWLAHVMTQRKRLWGFDDEQREVLVAATEQIPSLRSLVARAKQSTSADLQGLWILQASVRELDEVYSLVEALTDETRSRRQLELLKSMRMTLCTSMDGF